MIAVVKDIEKRKLAQKRVEDQLELVEDLNARLHVNNDKLQQFAHLLSHDLRSPITTIKAILNLWDITDGEEEKEDLIEKMNQVTDNMLEIVGDVSSSLNDLQIENINKEKIKLDEIIHKVVENLSGFIIQKNAKINYNSSPEHIIYGNRSYLISIFQNLIGNAVKYSSSERKPQIHIHYRQDEKFTVIEVKDNGIGIDLEKNRDHIFKMYKTFHDNHDAHGVGLFLVKMQAEAMNGAVDVKSKVNEGTTFIIKIPNHE